MSPVSNVGIIEPLGIRNGSKRKERRIKMKKITGKKPAVYSSHLGRSVEAWTIAFLVATTVCSPLRRESALSRSNAVNSSCAAARRFGAQIKTSSTQRTPVKTVKRKRINEKVISIYPLEGLLFIVLLKDGKEGFLRNLHGTDLLHSFLTGLLFFQKFTLTCNVAAVALG